MRQDEPYEPVRGLNDRHAYYCAFCGEENEVFIDAGGGRRQQFTEDCEVCCRPNLISVLVDVYGNIDIDVTQEYEA